MLIECAYPLVCVCVRVFACVQVDAFKSRFLQEGGAGGEMGVADIEGAAAGQTVSRSSLEKALALERKEAEEEEVSELLRGLVTGEDDVMMERVLHEAGRPSSMPAYMPQKQQPGGAQAAEYVNLTRLDQLKLVMGARLPLAPFTPHVAPHQSAERQRERERERERDKGGVKMAQEAKGLEWAVWNEESLGGEGKVDGEQEDTREDRDMDPQRHEHPSMHAFMRKEAEDPSMHAFMHTQQATPAALEHHKPHQPQPQQQPQQQQKPQQPQPQQQASAGKRLPLLHAPSPPPPVQTVLLDGEEMGVSSAATVVYDGEEIAEFNVSRGRLEELEQDSIWEVALEVILGLALLLMTRRCSRVWCRRLWPASAPATAPR
jgi:hypothetical protein